jgi:hypothetical protein
MQDHYIPLRPADLVRLLGNEPSVTIFEREQFHRLCQLVSASIHHEYHSRLEELKAAYSPFDPDDDATRQAVLNEADVKAGSNKLFGAFDEILARANYRRLSRDEIERAIHSPSHAGLRLHIDLDLFERLEVYVRGRCEVPANERRWRKAVGWLGLFFVSSPGHVPATVSAYRRLAIIFRLRQGSPLTDPLDARAVMLKLFKDIPQDDIEKLLPGASVRMGLFEQAQIVVPTLSGIALTLIKLLKGAAAVAYAGLYGLIAFLGLIGGAIGYGVKSFFSYLRTREKHQLCLTRQLYYQNLDNNAGVLYHLLNEAEEQEFREVILGWWLLWRGGLAGSAAEQIDRAAESWLKARCGIDADFEVSDALAKLNRLQMARQSSQRWRAATIEEALEALDRTWDEQFDCQRREIVDARPTLWRNAA